MRLPIRAKEPLIETLPLEERIRQRANELYVGRGNQFGSNSTTGCKQKGKLFAPIRRLSSTKLLKSLSRPAIRQPIRSIRDL